MWCVTVATRRGPQCEKVPRSQAHGHKRDFQGQKVEKPVPEKAVEEPKSIRRICIRFSDLTTEENYSFIRYWIKFMGIDDRRTGQGLTKKMCESLWKTVQTLTLHFWMQSLIWTVWKAHLEA